MQQLEHGKTTSYWKQYFGSKCALLAGASDGAAVFFTDAIDAQQAKAVIACLLREKARTHALFFLRCGIGDADIQLLLFW